MVLRNNLNIVPQVLLVFLSTLENVETYDYNCIDGTLQLETNQDWTFNDEVSLDNFILENTIVKDYIVLDVNNISIASLKEFNKKINKEGTIKNKVISFDYNLTNSYLKLKVVENWSESNQTTLDSLLDNLVGYDVVLQIMDIYQAREKDGQIFYNRKRSELVAKIQSEEITSAEGFELYNILKNVKESVRTGDWITAKDYLNAIEIQGLFTQEVKDEYNLELDEYILNNY